MRAREFLAEAIQTIIAKPNDTVYGIARQYNIDPNILFNLNGMNNKTLLQPGQKIKVPASVKPVATPVSADAPDEMETLIKQRLGDEERKNLIAMFSQDLPPEKSKVNPVKTSNPKGKDLPPMPPLTKPTAVPGKITKPTPTATAPRPPVKEIPDAPGAVPKEVLKKYLLSKMDEPHAIGMMVNMYHESSFIPKSYNPNDRGGPSGGLCAWHDNKAKGYHRFTNMTKAVPNWQTNWQGQVDYAISEPIGRKYFSTHYATAEQASVAWTNMFEIPADANKTANTRANSPMMHQLASNP
jgi:LysM repeat protein